MFVSRCRQLLEVVFWPSHNFSLILSTFASHRLPCPTVSMRNRSVPLIVLSNSPGSRFDTACATVLTACYVQLYSTCHSRSLCTSESVQAKPNQNREATKLAGIHNAVNGGL